MDKEELLMICCDGDTYNCDPAGGSGGGPVGIWHSSLVWEHSPGFFSCERFQGEVLAGTYDTCLNFHAQLCHIGSKSVIRTFSSSESIYHLRNQGDDHCYLACEQGNLYRLNTPLGSPVLVESQTYPMGYYDACDGDGHRYSVEKKSVHPPNQVKIRRDGADFVTANFGCKEICWDGSSLWLGAYHISNSDKCALCRLDVGSRTLHFGTIYRGHIVCPTLYDGKIWAALQLSGGGAAVINSSGYFARIEGNQGWMCKVVNGVLVVTTTDGRWRGYGPSHLFEWSGSAWVKVLDMPDAEPWDICAGSTADEFYLVTRNEHLSCGMGRVYKLERT